MTKTHIVTLNIANDTPFSLRFIDAWFESGNLADGNSWPSNIDPGAAVSVECCETDFSLAGCSGWVQYQIFFQSSSFGPIYFAFSNPDFAENGINVGFGSSAWDDMTSQYDCPAEKTLNVSASLWLGVYILSTSGDNNHASWNMQFFDLDEITIANTQVSDARSAFSNIPTTPTGRLYYDCSSSPTSPTGLAQSHFKGIASYADKLIFTHTNLDIIATLNGKYIIANKFVNNSLGMTEGTFDTLHEGWAHPCAAQACGSFMAMGIQRSASGSGSETSQIQILDIRAARANQPVCLLGSIDRPNDGINGVAMTKETGPDGRYIVAGVNGSKLSVYRSLYATLMADDGTPNVFFDLILEMDDFPESGAGLALVTQQDGSIFLITMNADEGNKNSKIALYSLDITTNPYTCRYLSDKCMPITEMSDCVTLLEDYLPAIIAAMPLLGAALSALLVEFGASILNSSFRWGKGLAITSQDTLEIYASDRNVLPLSEIPLVGSKKDFSVLVWKSGTSH